MTKDNILDKFYTKDEVAKHCVEQVLRYIDVSKMTVLEPSAGDGAFLPYFTKYIACDIAPQNANILQKDFLSDDISMLLPARNTIVTIGNPPFGKRSKLAIQFINKSFEYSDIVAFILPLQFNKYSAQSQVYKDAKLIHSEILPADSFLNNGKSYSVRCCFQIWSCNTNFVDLRVREKPITKHPDFEMYQYNNTIEASKYFNKQVYKWDFAVPRQGYKDYSTKETNPDNMDRHTQWIFFKTSNEKILKRLQNMDFEKLSKKNTSTPGFGKADVIEEYNRLYDNVT